MVSCHCEDSRKHDVCEAWVLIEERFADQLSKGGIMRKWNIGLFCLCITFFLVACDQTNTNSDATEGGTPESSQLENISQTPDDEPARESSDVSVQPEDTSKILVAYFSRTGNTAPLAEYTAEITGADIYEIVPEVPYTDDDIAYQVNDCRANLEQNDDTCRPAVSSTVIDMEDYDVVFIAFPIWWGKEPRIIDTFMDTYDFSGKTLIPFCTSGSSGIGTAESNLHAMTDETARWLDGARFAAGTSKNTMEEWINSLMLSVK